MSSIPFVRYFLPFAAGLILNQHLEFSFPNVAILCASSFLLSLINKKLQSIQSRFRYQSFNAALLFLSITFFGFAVESWHRLPSETIIEQEAQLKTIYLVQIEEPWKKKGFYPSTRGIILKKLAGDFWVTCSERIQIRASDKLKTLPESGSIVEFFGEIKEVSPQKNPFDMDYKTYLRQQKIYRSLFLKDGNYRIKSRDVPSLKQRALSIQEKLYSILESNLHNPHSSALTGTLLLGTRSELDQEVIQAFSATGTIHVLSVSGMHVGLIYFALSLLFGVFPKKGIGLIISTTLLIFTLWFYALITGFSPSVLRAVMMLSLLILGNASGMKPNIYNTLAASAFLLICYDPQLLFHAGFQLSFMAVLGIVTLHPVIYPTFYFKRKILDKIWTLTSVSLAAQLATFPLALYHFGIFPNYFLIANLLILPIATGILFTGIALLLTYFIPIIGTGIAWALNVQVQILTLISEFISDLPGATTFYAIDSLECFLLYLILAGFLFAFTQKNWLAFKLSLLFVIAFLNLRVFHELNAERINELTIAYSKDGVIMDLMDNGHALTVFLKSRSDTIVAENTRKKIQTYHLKRRIDHESVVVLNLNEFHKKIWHSEYFHIESGVFLYRNRKIAIASQKRKSKRLNVDILLVSGLLPYTSTTDLNNFFPRIIVLDANCGKKRSEKWKKIAEQKSIPLYEIRENNALRLHFPLFFL